MQYLGVNGDGNCGMWINAHVCFKDNQVYGNLGLTKEKQDPGVRGTGPHSKDQSPDAADHL